MTVDHETIEALRDDPELLALADALQSAGNRIEAPAVRRPRRLSIRVAAVGLAAIAALVLLLVSPWDSGSGPSFVDKALAAVGDEPVLHVVERYDIGQRIDLRTGRTTSTPRDFELWYDAGRHVYRYVGRLDGRVISRGSGTGNLSTEPFLLSDLYRRALKQGQVHKTGEATVRGHRTIVVESHQPHGGGIVRAYLDARTYRLLRMQFLLGGQVASQIDVLRFETVSRAQAHLPKPKPGAATQSPGAVTISGSSSSASERRTDLAGARSAFAQPALWAGKSVRGNRLTSVSLEDVTESQAGAQVRGTKVVVDYGVSGQTLDVGEANLELEEAPAASPLWRAEKVYAPPPGYIDVLSGEESSSNTGDRTRWDGVMQKDGFVVKLSAWDKATLLAAARALRPVP